MSEGTLEIEQQLTILLRRNQRIHLSTTIGDIELDRSAYGIMCRLADDGPQRLGALAQKFGLDPSTITRQVQSLEGTKLVSRTTDPADRRASLLNLTDEGARILGEVRRQRRERFQEVFSEWTPQERAEFGRLLRKFNSALEPVVAS